jgi:hypothetical protein
VVWIGRDALGRAGVAGNGERGENAEAQICAAGDEEVGDFHTQLVQSNNVATVNL